MIDRPLLAGAVLIGILGGAAIISWIFAIGRQRDREADQLWEAEANHHPILRILRDPEDRP